MINKCMNNNLPSSVFSFQFSALAFLPGLKLLAFAFSL
jgi:hypothetical protein